MKALHRLKTTVWYSSTRTLLVVRLTSIDDNKVLKRITLCDIKQFFFDVDGTLAETEELHLHAFKLAFKKAGLTWHWN
tara:strand:- start:102 stop:335 length:234 start_codon:yes stop_codon:yes gene_type:complete